jgi:SAM-dependent methyltransferase
MQNKIHYYDGIFYDKFIAPNQDKLFRIIKSLIPKDSSLLDVGTGTGRFLFQYGKHLSFGVGIDLSSRNIKLAKKKLTESDLSNIEFIHGSILNIENLTDKRFDYAMTTFVLHEMPPQMRIDALRKMHEVAENIIIGDYIVPLPQGLDGLSVKVIEFLAGPDHFKNFRNYVINGGIEGLAAQSGIKILKKISDKMPHAEIAVLA